MFFPGLKQLGIEPVRYSGIHNEQDINPYVSIRNSNTAFMVGVWVNQLDLRKD